MLVWFKTLRTSTVLLGLENRSRKLNFVPIISSYEKDYYETGMNWCRSYSDGLEGKIARAGIVIDDESTLISLSKLRGGRAVFRLQC